MAASKPISTAPMDGRKVRVVWTDEDGQENESMAQYRSLDRMRAGGGEWDDSDAGWWVFVDGSTQRKVTPHGWLGADDAD